MKRFWILLGVLLAALPVAAQTESVVYATAQRYERGMMIWRADTGHIWALANDGRAFNFPAPTYTTLPDNPIFGDPPSRLRPIHGMGKVWGHNVTVRAALGWPTLDELGFNMPVQQVGGSTYLTQLDGSVLQIRADNTWTRAPGSTSPAINHFSAAQTTAAPGSTITLNWQVQGTDAVLIEVYAGPDRTMPAQLVQNLPLIGSAPITIPANTTESVHLILWGIDYAPGYNPANLVARIVDQRLVIPLDWPQETRTMQAAFQQYEKGFLIWRADTGAVMVFGGDLSGQYLSFQESTYAPWPDAAGIYIPANRVRPINAFGKVWSAVPAVRQMLGYATGPEQGYTLTIHQAAGGVPTARYSLPAGSFAVVSRHQFWTLNG